MGVEIRAVREAEVAEFQAAMTAPFGFDVCDEMRTQFPKVFEVARMRAAVDGGQIVGTIGTHTVELSVPGGSLPMAGTTIVTVLPTHRRQGVMRRLISQHLQEAHDQGESLAGLWASESSIYGRFGYGNASDRLTVDVHSQFAEVSEPIDIAGRTRLVSKEEAISLFPAIYEEARQGRGGMLSRKASWWSERRLADSEYQREGASKQRRVVLENQGVPEGYLVYRTSRDGDGFEVRIVELVGVSSEAERALWQFAFNLDLVVTIRYDLTPPDSPVLWMLKEPRRLNRRVEDGLWIRVIDVVKALMGRSYEIPGTLRMRLTDSLCEWNQGVFQLDVDSQGRGHCQPSEGSAEITMDVAQLGALFLGGRSCRELAQAGLVHGEETALKTMDQMFRSFPAPWCAEIF